MTSRHLFFKAMREDMRHRSWMLALSVLGSLLALPVTWLIGINNVPEMGPGVLATGAERADYLLGIALDFWRATANALGGLVLIGGALVAALAGFRYIFHKSQVDTWHSLPIKRGTLFWACYINGVVVWLLPMLIGAALAAALSGGTVLGAESGSMAYFYEVAKAAAETFAVWLTVFMLVYNMVLLAMMLCGNVLNTMVSMLVMGFGAIGLYTLIAVTCEYYLDTWNYYGVGGDMLAVYASPFFSAIMLLAQRAEVVGGCSVWMGLLAAAALAAAAWILYRRRPSELAEQGIRSRIFSTALRLVTTVGAGISGWMFFCVLTGDQLLWSIFGAVLAAVLVHGVLDVVFRMEFRAFFAHRLQMAGTAAGVLLVCFAIRGDWLGYDSYLPGKEQIAEIGVQVDALSNRVFYDSYPLAAMEYRDIEAAYAFLQKMSEVPLANQENRVDVGVRILLKNGKTYYRRYFVGKEERDLLMPIVSSGEYMKHAYCLSEQVAQDREVTLRPVMGTWGSLGRWGYREREFARGELLEFFRAYNQDVLEHPETVLLGEGRLLTEVRLSYRREDGYGAEVTLRIYESMERTLDALRALGYESQIVFRRAEQVASVNLNISVGNWGEARTAQELVEAARRKYGESAGVQTGESAEAVSGAASAESWDYPYTVYDGETQELVLHITEPEEIEELLSLISYSREYMGVGVFKKRFIDISMTDTKGEDFTCYIKKGELPEKYIRRFGELAKEPDAQ